MRGAPSALEALAARDRGPQCTREGGTCGPAVRTEPGAVGGRGWSADPLPGSSTFPLTHTTCTDCYKRGHTKDKISK